MCPYEENLETYLMILVLLFKVDHIILEVCIWCRFADDW